MVLGIEAEAPDALETNMSEKKSVKVTTRAKVAKPKKEKPPKEQLVVFAFRLTEDERKKIHATAGPANASRFVRQVASAFAAEDEAAFRAVLKEASEARS